MSVGSVQGDRRRDANLWPSVVSAEREIGLNPRDVSLIDQYRLARLAFAFRILCRKQVTPPRLSAQHLAAGGDLGSFRHRLLRFTAGNRLGHSARKICAAAAITNIFSWLVPPGDQRLEAPSANISATGRIRCGEQAPEKLPGEIFKVQRAAPLSRN